MNLLTRLSLKNRALIGLITVVAVLFGIIATGQVKRELFPAFENPQVMINTEYKGASPEAVEREVTDVIEDAVKTSDKVESVDSTSSSGRSEITADVAFGTKSDDIVRELQGSIAKVKGQLPDGVDPLVVSGSTDDIPVLVLSVSSDGKQDELADDLENVAVPELKKAAGVRSVQLSGADTKQVNIKVDKKKLDDKGVSVDEIAGVLQANGVAASAGEISGDNGKSPVEVGARITKIDQIKDLRLNGKDGSVKLSEVAEVKQAPAPAVSISRTNGKDSLTLVVMKKPDANTVEVAEAVQNTLPKVEDRLRGSPEFTTVFDQSPYIKQSIDDLVREGVLGLVFAVLVILVFLLSPRATVITAISIPLSLLITMIALWRVDYSLNMLTLSALTISIGRVVDDSIVVIEAIRRRHSLGGTKFNNILSAVGEVAGAITASTLTTVAVFVPLIFVSGQVGELFRPFALTASIALLASLLVALTIVPVLAYWFLRSRESRVKLDKEQKKEIAARRKEGLRGLRASRKERRRKKKGAKAPQAPAAEAAPTAVMASSASSDEAEEAESAPSGTAGGEDVDELASLHSPVTRLQKSYTPIIGWTIRHPVITLAASVLVLVMTFGMVPLLKTEFLGDTGSDTLNARQVFPAGADLQKAGKLAEPVEKEILATDGVDDLSFTVGSNEMGMGGTTSSGELSGSYLINLTDGADSAKVSDDLKKKFKKFGSDSGKLEMLDGSGPGSSTIDVKLTANDPKALEKSAQKLTEKLKDTDGVEKVENSQRAVSNVVHIDLKRKKAAEYGISEAQLGQIVSRAVDGQMVGQVVLDNVTNSVYLFDGKAKNIEDLENIKLKVMEMPDGTPAGGAGGAGAGGPGGGAGGAGGAGGDAGAGAGGPGGAGGPMGGGRVDSPSEPATGAATDKPKQPGMTDAPKAPEQKKPEQGGKQPQAPSGNQGGQDGKGGQQPQMPQGPQGGDNGQQPQMPEGGMPQAPGGEMPEGGMPQAPGGEMPEGGMPQAPPAPQAPPQPEEKTIKLKDIANVTEAKTAPVIAHSDGLRSVTVSATPEGDDLGKVASAVNAAVDDTELEPGVTRDTGGAAAEQADGFKQLGLAMLAAILVVFIILVATFRSLLQPFILLVSIPFAATGSIVALLVTGTPMGMTSMIGMLMLIGIVVTNAIVLIDLINRFRDHGVPLHDVVFHGARLRYRPIIMTALATIFALLPMALGITPGGMFISRPLALAVIGGLVSSTALTLILVPVLYQLVEGAKERRAEKKAVKESARASVIDEAEAGSRSGRQPAAVAAGDADDRPTEPMPAARPDGDEED